MTYYEGLLLNGVSKQDRTLEGIRFPWPAHGKPMFFYHSAASNEEISAAGSSFLNRIEAFNVVQVVSAFLQAGVRPD